MSEEVSAFQINDMAIFTIKEGEELLLSGIAPVQHDNDGRGCTVTWDGKFILCSVEHTNDDPEKVGHVEGQRRFYWRGKVQSVVDIIRIPD